MLIFAAIGSKDKPNHGHRSKRLWRYCAFLFACGGSSLITSVGISGGDSVESSDHYGHILTRQELDGIDLKGRLIVGAGYPAPVTFFRTVE